MYSVEILANSISPMGHRLTTMKITFPRFILSEFNTHRMFSRNSASSRAIPFSKMLEMVNENPFIPIAWQKHHKGMQGKVYETNENEIFHNKQFWLRGRDTAIHSAINLDSQGVTKQLCNRLLEPFMWHTVIVTATEWENFFELRCPKYLYYDMITGDKRYFRSKHDWLSYHNNKPLPKGCHVTPPSTELDWLLINESHAEIHIQKIAEMMWTEYNNSIPDTLEHGEWHIPFSDKIPDSFSIHEKLKIATARCARISYETLGETRKIDYDADIKLHDRLLNDKHLSPFEHCAQVMDNEDYHIFFAVDGGSVCNNFYGFIQYRYRIDEKIKSV